MPILTSREVVSVTRNVEQGRATNRNHLAVDICHAESVRIVETEDKDSVHRECPDLHDRHRKQGRMPSMIDRATIPHRSIRYGRCLLRR